MIFDVEREFRFPFGQRVIFSTASDKITNPFHIRTTIIDTDESLSDERHSNKKVIATEQATAGKYLSLKIPQLVSFFKWVLGGMDAEDEAIIEEDIRDAYKSKGLDFNSIQLPGIVPTISTLVETMKGKIDDPTREYEANRRRRMILCLRPYYEGSYAPMFNGQTNWDFTDFTVLDIFELPEAVQGPMYSLLIEDVWEVIKQDRHEKIGVYIDEAHVLSNKDNPQTMKFISTRLIKRARKYATYAVIATQNFADFMAVAEHGTNIINNCFFKTFMRLGPGDVKEAREIFESAGLKLSSRELKVISSTKGRGGGIYIAGNMRVQIQTKASDFELEIIDPDGYEKLTGRKSRYRRRAA
ncbi:hypothetical protein ACWKT5_37055 [Streptomyces avermitilis]